MTISSSRNTSHRKPRLNRLQMPQHTLALQLEIIPEEDEPHCPAPSFPPPCLSSIRSEFNIKRTFSTSHIEVSFSDDTHDQQDWSLPRPAPTPPRFLTSYGVRSGATSPTPSTSSSSSSGLPLTPTSSDDEFPTAHFNPRRASIKPGYTPTLVPSFPTSAPFSESVSDEDDESDSEWYTREFSKILFISSPIPPSFSKQQQQQSPRPESLFLEPALAEEPIDMRYPTNYERSPAPHTHKRSRSIPRETPPPVPPIPAHFLPPSTATPAPILIPKIVWTGPAPVPDAKPCPRSLSLRRPPPRSSIPYDCITDDAVMGGDESSWPSAFDISSYEQPSPAPSPAFISDSCVPAQHESFLTISPALDSPASMYSQGSALSSQTIADLDGFGDFEFAVDDIKFSLTIDAPMRLPLSLPNSPLDLEADIAHGLEELRKAQESPRISLVRPTIATSGARARAAEPVEKIQPEPLSESDLPSGSSDLSPSSPSTPTTATSFISFYDSTDSEERFTVGDDSPATPVLRSRWSTSTLASIRDEHAARSGTLAAAHKLRLYFGGGNSSLSKSKQQHHHQANRNHQQQRQQQRQQQQHEKPNSAGITVAKAVVTRTAPGPVHHSSSYPNPPGSTAPLSVKKKKAQRQVVILPPRTPTTAHMTSKSASPSSIHWYSSHSSDSSSPMSPPSPPPMPLHGYGKVEANLSKHESDVMIIGYGYGGVGESGLRRDGVEV